MYFNNWLYNYWFCFVLIAMRTDIARRAQSKSENMREKMLEAKETIQTEKQTKLDISAGKCSA